MALLYLLIHSQPTIAIAPILAFIVTAEKSNLRAESTLRTFIHLLEVVEEDAVEKKDAGKDAAEKEVAKKEFLEKDEASIGGVHDRFVAHVTPKAVEVKPVGEEDGKQLPRN